jgi:diguanylate cyclase (GGDEF)-like protein
VTDGRPDPRNVLVRASWFAGYVAAVTLAGLAALVVLLVTQDLGALARLEPAFWAVAALVIVGEARPLFPPGARDVNGVALSTAFVFAMLLRYDLTVALSLQAIALVVTDLRTDRAVWRTAFNVAQYTLSWSACWGVMTLQGHEASVAHPATLGPSDLGYAGAGGITYFVVNEVLVGLAISLSSRTRLREVLSWTTLRYDLLTTGALVALGPLVVLTLQAGSAFVPLLIPPFAAVYAAAAAGKRSEQLALKDALTGLANRTQLRRHVRSGPCALVLLDLDRFKEVNDTLGHHVGDQLLVAVAGRLTGCVRPDDLVARFGGDEFALLLPHGDVTAATRAAERAREALSKPFSLGGLLVEVGASAGIAVAPDHGGELDVLLQRADVAMYLSKESGEVEVYEAHRDPNTTGRLVLLGALRRALELEELEVHYQPKASLATGKVVGVEALVRWQHPQLGLVHPDAFIPLAERSGLIGQLTSWVLDEAVRQASVWWRRGWDITLSVNVTVKDLCSDAFVEQLDACLARHSFPAPALQLEVTEGSMFSDSTRARTTVKQLLDRGVTFSLDDFGIGWSSLVRLRHLPVTEIKVDRSFVCRMVDDVRDRAIVQSVVDLARGLGLRVVAEGVEDRRTWDLLADLGADGAQGWWLSPPLPADDVEAWLSERFAPTS